MSIHAFLLWILSFFGISNGPCGPTRTTGEIRGVDAAQCMPTPQASSHARTNEDTYLSPAPTGPAMMESGPTDDISNGF